MFYPEESHGHAVLHGAGGAGPHGHAAALVESLLSAHDPGPATAVRSSSFPGSARGLKSFSRASAAIRWQALQRHPWLRIVPGGNLQPGQGHWSPVNARGWHLPPNPSPPSPSGRPPGELPQPRPAPGPTHKPNISNPPVQHSFERAKQDLEQVRISLCVLSERHHDTANQNHCWAVRQSQTEPVQMGQTLGPGPAEQMHLSMGREVIWHKCQNAV